MAPDEPTRDVPDAVPSPLSRARRVAGHAAQAGPAGQASTPPAPNRPPQPTRPTPRAAPRPGRSIGRSGQPGVTWILAAPSSGAPADDAAPDEPSSTSKAGRNLPVAIGVGAGLGLIVVGSLFVYRPSFAVLVGLAVVYGCYELSHALRAGGIRISLLPVLVGGAAMQVAAWERGPSGLVLAALITVLGVMIWRVADGAHGYTRDVTASALTLLYLPTLAGFAILLAHPGDGAGRVIAFVATVVCSDTGGYAAGVLFGRHPLAPIVSKAKTWEGFAGSVLACSGAGVLFMTLTFHEAWWKGLLFGVAIVVTATLGDLGESMIKRDLKVKDMGKLLPGHGGLMDRLDSLLPCAAVAYLLLSGFVPVR
jgi:phosphatidate cytidylyltransferase